MRPAGRPAELFEAFSRINRKALAGNRLLSCPNLSKAPNYGNVLRRFLAGKRPVSASPSTLAKTVLRYLLNNTGQLLFLLCVRFFIFAAGWKLPPPLTPEACARPKRSFRLLDTFALLPRIAADGKVKEMYMPGLDKAVEGAGLVPVFLYRLYGTRNPRTVWKALRVFAAEGRGVTELHFFTWKDWLALARHAVAYPFSLRRLIRSLAHYPADSPERHIREALIHTAGQCVLHGEVRRLAGKRLGLWLASWPPDSSAPPLPEIFSWYENQTINKAFQRGLAEAEAATGRHIRVTGAQLFIWPDNLLNNHADDVEVALNLVPDTVLVCGPHFLPEGSKQEYVVGPALRYGSLFSPPKPETGTKAKHLLALLSYHPEETVRVLDMLLPLADAGEAVAYKFHPAVNPEQYKAWLPRNPVLIQGGLAEALAGAKAVVGSGSGSLAEAAALGVPVLAVEDNSGIPGMGLNYLPPQGEGRLWFSVASEPDVREALVKLPEALDPEEVNAFRDLLFAEPTEKRIRESFGL